VKKILPLLLQNKSKINIENLIIFMYIPVSIDDVDVINADAI
jgi:hypothetical protein